MDEMDRELNKLVQEENKKQMTDSSKCGMPPMYNCNACEDKFNCRTYLVAIGYMHP